MLGHIELAKANIRLIVLFRWGKACVLSWNFTFESDFLVEFCG